MIDNYIVFPNPPSFQKSHLRVKGYAHFSKAISGTLDRRLHQLLVDRPTDDRSLHGWSSIAFMLGSFRSVSLALIT